MTQRITIFAAAFGLILTLAATPGVAQQASKGVDPQEQAYPEGFEHVEAIVSLLDQASKAVENAPGPSGTISLSTLSSSTAPDFFALLTQLSQNWDPLAGGGSGDWVNESHVAYTRNDDGFDTELFIQSWDPVAGDWMPDLRRTTMRDDRNRAIQTLDEGYDSEANSGSGGYVPFQRRSLEWNEQDNITMSTTELFDEDAGDYFIWNRSTYTFDSSGEVLLQRLFESALFGPLAPSLRYNYAYNSRGLEESVRRESYDRTTEEFENSGLNEYTYDSNDEEIEDLESDWDETANGGSGDWVKDARTTTEFVPNSSNPTMITETDQSYDPVADDWINEEREISAITGSNEITETEQEWDPDAAGKVQGAWVNVEQSIVTLTNDGPGQAVNQVWDAGAGDWLNESRNSVEFDERGLAVSSLTEIWDGGGWVNSNLLTMTYGEYGSSTDIESEGLATGYELKTSFPNPFGQSTTISFTLPQTEHVTLEVFDMLGRRIDTLVDQHLGAGTHSVTMEAGDLPGGLYMYRLSSARTDLTQSMLLLR